MKSMKEKHIFVWRTKIESMINSIWFPSSCPYCKTVCLPSGFNENLHSSTFGMECKICGWSYEYRENYLRGTLYNNFITERCLTDLDINSPKLSISEIGTHLNKTYSDIYSLSPRRFEELICDIFKRNGHDPLLTQQTRDGGVDIILLSNPKPNTFSLIQCKRYSATRKIGIETIRTLLGTIVMWGTNKAYLVTSSNFSTIARVETELIKEKGYEIDLISATELCRFLGVYNENLPSLDKISESIRRDIFEQN